MNLGAFYDEPAHTRLVSYAELADLRSDNQFWPDDEGNIVWRAKPNAPGLYIHENRNNKPHRRPFVYMGPGIWFDQDPVGRRVHIRLAPTTNNIPNWPDYDPAESDPNRLQLALSVQGKHAIFLKRCQHIQFQDLTLRFGNPDTVLLNNCVDIGFDHCRIRSGEPGDLPDRRGRTDDREHPDRALRDRRRPADLVLPQRPEGHLPPRAERQAGGHRGRDARNKLGYATSGVQMSGDARSSERGRAPLRDRQRARQLRVRRRDGVPPQLGAQPERRRHRRLRRGGDRRTPRSTAT